MIIILSTNVESHSKLIMESSIDLVHVEDGFGVAQWKSYGFPVHGRHSCHHSKVIDTRSNCIRFHCTRMISFHAIIVHKSCIPVNLICGQSTTHHPPSLWCEPTHMIFYCSHFAERRLCPIKTANQYRITHSICIL